MHTCLHKVWLLGESQSLNYVDTTGEERVHQSVLTTSYHIWVDLEKSLGGGLAKFSGHKSCSAKMFYLNYSSKLPLIACYLSFLNCCSAADKSE